MSQTMEEHLADEHGWIERRAAEGYDFTDLVRALSRLDVRVMGSEIVIDASDLTEDPHLPTTHTLLPAEVDGQWYHEGAGTEARLMEHLIVAALICVELEDSP